MLKIGVKGNKTITVKEENTAAVVGSGELAVFATPSMLALMEATCAESIRPFLDDDSSSVGILANIRHSSATPVGMIVNCASEITEIDGKRIVFKVFAYDESGLIGDGVHERYIIKKEKFLKKAYGKKDD